MYLRDIAISNLRVRKSKMLFLILGIVLGITTVVALTSITVAMEEQLESNFKAMGTKVLITPISKSLSLSYNGVSVASATSYQSAGIPDGTLTGLDSYSQRGVGIISPKLVRPAEINSTRVLVAGVRFDGETRLKPYWKIDGRVPGADEIMLGAVAAQKLALKVNDTVEIAGQPFTVAGVLQETGAAEDKLVQMELSKAQEIFKEPGAVSFVELNVKNVPIENESEINPVVKSIQEEFPQVNVKVIKDQTEARREVVERFAKFSLLVSIVVLFIGCLIVLTTMMASVKERTREIGIFRAIGFRQQHIIKIILTEALIISSCGGVIGYIAGVVLAKVTAPFIAQIDVQVGWSLGIGLAAILVSALVGLLSSAYPAYQAAKLDPVEAFRFI
ncbi:ABC transporter permease [Metallumcola ferriviriculae]|uniref:ABC transporter permease n=1 Tax=Metallumcola ferriviriculae TaxID=3039180 RepID=A0AAU0UK93_9FIRM|nr:ABC transporter permease [Desulfitibacteraceae bacterium MK1]